MDYTKKNVSRRDFVKGSSLMTGGILLAPSILSSTPLFKNEKVKNRKNRKYGHFKKF